MGPHDGLQAAVDPSLEAVTGGGSGRCERGDGSAAGEESTGNRE